MLLPNWDCTTCKAQQKLERGCTTEPLIPQEMDGEVLTRCPRRPMLDYPALFADVFSVYSWYKRGGFPDKGTYLDQAAAFVQVVEIIEQAIAEAKAAKEKIEATKASIKKPSVVR